ncbi:MBL fold metallo-hydrolase [Candidatus Woesearchaeota archaeon]|nr:MBL fold metallo-hydrolase [Candidatus Woesearchaeota archaeon]
MKAGLVLLAVLALLLAGCSPQNDVKSAERGDAKMSSSDILDSVNWFGHASFMFTDKASGNRIYYIDPFEFKGDGKANPSRQRSTGPSRSSDLGADIIFITHAHYDHCDPDSVKKILKPETVIVVPGGCKEKLGVRAEFVDAVPNREYDIKGFKFRTVPAYNIKPDRLQYHPKSSNWVGYVFQLNNQTVYHAGDTDFIPEMKQLGKISVAMLPIGGTYTMDVDEAIAAANAIRADVTVPMHYRRLLGSNYSSAEEEFRAGVKNSRVVILEQVA